MHFKRLQCLLALALFCCLQATAATINTDSLLQAERKEERRIPRMVAGYVFNINGADDLTFSHELDFQWYFLKYMGVGMGMELDTNNTNTSLFLSDKDSFGNDRYEYDPDDITKLNFHPMLSFRSPTVWFSRTSSWGVMLRCDPGLVMSLPANDVIWIDPNDFLLDKAVIHDGNVRVANHGGKWLFYRVRTALSFYSSFCMLSIGWSFSDYNINYCRNNMAYNGYRFYHKDRYSHTGTLLLGLSVCF